MLRAIMLLVLGFSMLGVQAQSMSMALKAKYQVSNLANYNRLSVAQRTSLEAEALRWLNKIRQIGTRDENMVLPDNYLDMPTHLVYHTTSSRAVNVIPGLKVAFVPKLSLFYSIYYQYYKALLRYGLDAPLPEVIFGMMNRETLFLWIKGDYGHSIAPCQLHKATAKWLLRSGYKSRFEKLLYFDKHGEHHFYSQDAMVAFVFEFLIHAKKYAQGRERHAIAAYNGSKPSAAYTQVVMRNSLVYLAMRMVGDNKMKKLPMDKRNLRILIQRTANEYIAKYGPFDLNYESILYYAEQFIESQQASYSDMPEEEHSEQADVSISSGKGMVIAPKMQFGRPYILKDKQVFMFSYFRENLDTTVFYHNKLVEQELGKAPQYSQAALDTNFVYLYYEVCDEITKQTQRYFIKTVEQYKQAVAKYRVMCSKENGKIYTIPGAPVYYNSHSGSAKVPSFFIDPKYIDPVVDFIYKNSKL